MRIHFSGRCIVQSIKAQDSSDHCVYGCEKLQLSQHFGVQSRLEKSSHRRKDNFNSNLLKYRETVMTIVLL